MSKEEKTVNVLILRQIDYKDNDAIVSGLSSNGQLYTFFARGVKKHTSKNASAVQPFMVSEVVYFESLKSMKLLKSAKVVKSMYDKYTDYDKMLLAHVVIDVVYDLVNMLVESESEVYTLLSDSLNYLNEIDNSLFLSSFLAQTLELSGTKLIYENCAICLSEVVNYISVNHGGFICHNCLSDNDKAIYNINVLKLFRIINLASYSKLVDLEYDKNDANTLLSIVYEFYNSYSGLTIKNINQFI